MEIEEAVSHKTLSVIAPAEPLTAVYRGNPGE